MSEQDDRHIVISPTIFYFLLGASSLGGAGLWGVTGSKIEAESLKACFDNSQTALSVAEQHGDELNGIRRELYTRTQLRYTSEDAENDQRKQARVDDIQDRRLTILESQMQKLTQ